MKKVVKRGVRFVGWRVNDELELHAPWASPTYLPSPTNRLTFGTNLISAGWSGLNNNKPVKNGGTIINWSCASLGLHTHYFLHWPINWKLILKFLWQIWFQPAGQILIFVLTNLIFNRWRWGCEKRLDNDELDLRAPQASHRAPANRLETICYPPDILKCFSQLEKYQFPGPRNTL